MVRSRIALAFAVLLFAATAADAQPSVLTGFVTGHLGVVASGDVRDATLVPGFSMAVLDRNGLGAEVDLSHAGDFDDSSFDDSSITSAMVNFMVAYPHERWRPFMVVGAGIMRVRVALANGPTRSHTDTAWDAGGGLIYMLSEAVSLRGDVRYFRHFGRQDALALGGNGTLEFVRTSFGVSFSWPID